MKIGEFFKKIYRKVLGLFPRKLPRGVSEFDAFARAVFGAYDVPNGPSYEQAIASMIMHLGPLVTSKSPYFFARSIRKSQANQVSFEIIQRCKKQMAEMDAALEAADLAKEVKEAV